MPCGGSRVYFLFKAEAAQETAGADCHSAAPELGNTQERHLSGSAIFKVEFCSKISHTKKTTQKTNDLMKHLISINKVGCHFKLYILYS